ncbi:hypothetical protein DN826_14340 [Stutzerimonas nosocomialis]|uniref:Bro-N domain-containing protein n=1 Tax=Stutzerimonas azotifigens TaxID=291995 RepID=A0ABR5Z1Y2_9GAMM|nr:MULTISPECIES: Bro-N domain-containing protein [Stutzerimonas]MBA1274164.1 Bro-N domain-containing protein [Stutzerimonas azotifigens]TLX54356.1 hypothetical protein DN826_14340 [Stutzerimonas nosocomialis]
MPTPHHPRFEGMRLSVHHEHDGRLWFDGNEIARLLDYSDGALAIHQYCRVEGLSFGEGDHPEPRLDLENVYRLAFASRSAYAPRFSAWLTHRLLPQLCNPKSSCVHLFGRQLQILDWQDDWWIRMRDVVEAFDIGRTVR